MLLKGEMHSSFSPFHKQKYALDGYGGGKYGKEYRSEELMLEQSKYSYMAFHHPRAISRDLGTEPDSPGPRLQGVIGLT